ncbi:uncharacterized protein METZ01_LOCUS360778, partial [marine metagenome]
VEEDAHHLEIVRPPVNPGSGYHVSCCYESIHGLFFDREISDNHLGVIHP